MAPRAMKFKVKVNEFCLQKRVLRFPREFSVSYGNVISKTLSLVVPDGLTWRVRWQRIGKDVVLCGDEWKDFVETYSLDAGYWVSFSFNPPEPHRVTQGHSEFLVEIFNLAGMEIQYQENGPGPSKKRKEHNPFSVVVYFGPSSFVDYSVTLPGDYVPPTCLGEERYSWEVMLRVGDNQWKVTLRQDQTTEECSFHDMEKFIKDNNLAVGQSCLLYENLEEEETGYIVDLNSQGSAQPNYLVQETGAELS